MHPQPETYWGNVNPIGPRGVYDEAKRYAEALTMAYHRQQGVDTASSASSTPTARACAARRPRDPDLHPPGARAKPMTVFGDGSQTRSFCYVDDLVTALSLLAESGEHLPVNIGNPHEFTILELAETVIASPVPARSCSRRCPSTIPKIRQPDITRARSPRLGTRDRARRGLRRLHAALQPAAVA